MSDPGSYLLVVVALLAVVALVMVGSSKPIGQRAAEKRRGLHPASSETSGSGGKRLHSGTKSSDIEDDGAVAQSPFLIPPPDEARIEAVAPNNMARGNF